MHYFNFVRSLYTSAELSTKIDRTNGSGLYLNIAVLILPLLLERFFSTSIVSFACQAAKNWDFPKAVEFSQIANFPRCIGAIDCTLIRINSPGGPTSEGFRNRHGYFSLNVQTIVDAKLRIMNVVARWPGSTHDSVVFANWEVRNRFDRGDFGRYVLVGDIGYANSAYLCTPFRANAWLFVAERAYLRHYPNIFQFV